MPRSSVLKKTVIASERDRPDIARRRAQWIEHQNRIKPERLVFIDETWTKTNMAPLGGWAPRGARLVAKVPHGHWKTLTFVAALRHDRIEAPFGSTVRSMANASKPMSRRCLCPRLPLATSC
jgi:putative transposase